MRTRLAVQNQTVSGQGRDQLMSRQAAELRVVDRHASDNYCHLGLAGYLHLIGGFGRQRRIVRVGEARRLLHRAQTPAQTMSCSRASLAKVRRRMTLAGAA